MAIRGNANASNEMSTAFVEPALKVERLAFGGCEVARYLQRLFLCDSAAAAVEPLCPSQLGAR